MTHPSGEAIELMAERAKDLEETIDRLAARVKALREDRNAWRDRALRRQDQINRLRRRLAVVCVFAERQMQQQQFIPHHGVWSRKHLEGK